MEEVKTQPQQVKQISLLDIINLIKKGMNLNQISKELKVSKQRINYYIKDAKQRGLVIKKGYGVWEVNTMEEVKTLTQTTNFKVKPDSIRGHAFVWKVRINNLKNINWKEYLNSKQINYDEMGISGTPRIILNGRKIWLGQKNIVIYELESFYGANSIETRKLAIFKLLTILGALERFLGLKFGRFEFTTTREHFSMIKNVLAIQCNKNNEKINVYNNKGLWLSIDDSFNLGELETLGSMQNDPLGTSLKVQKWWNSNKDTDFKVTPEYILNSFDTLIKDREYWAEHQKSHVEAIQKLGDAVNKLTKLVDELKGGQNGTK